jgi:hypothetical protein
MLGWPLVADRGAFMLGAPTRLYARVVDQKRDLELLSGRLKRSPVFASSSVRSE